MFAKKMINAFEFLDDFIVDDQVRKVFSNTLTLVKPGMKLVS